MGTLMESKLTAEQHALVSKALVAQTESLGVLETPIVEDLLRRHKARTVLDIGCGEGSFLLQLAHRLQGVRFLGIDHNQLAVRDAVRKARRRSLDNVAFRTAFFDAGFERPSYDAILTRYTLQHSSRPEAFVKAVFDRVKRRGIFIALESLDEYTDCHVHDPIWERYRIAVASIHKRVGSNANIGKSLGSLLVGAGFRKVRVQVVLSSPSTVGVARFAAVVRATAALAFGFFPDLFDRRLHRDLERWLADRKRLVRHDPYLCSAIAHATKP